MDYTLIVIDMQEGFDAANDIEVQDNVTFEINHAKSQNAYVLIVEYVDNGPTLPNILDLVKGYDKCIIIQKYDDDGAPWIVPIAERERLPRNIFICGVNYSACVEFTVKGMIKEYDIDPTNITVIRDACNNSRDWDHDRYWDNTTRFFVTSGVNLA